jgi:DNA-directed RNA polymerase subunit RPC12/RpoP
VLPPRPSIDRVEREYVEVADRAYARTDCPHCGVQLERLPKSKKRCPACGHEIFVRSGPDNRRYLLRADERDAIEAQWHRQREADWSAQHARAEAALDGWLHQVATSGITVGDMDLEAVGESFHLDVLVALKQRYPDGLAVALLRREPANPYDRDAVEVLVDGLQVGHLSREDAADYQGLLQAAERSGRGVFLVAELVGGEIGPDGLHAPIGVFFEHAPEPE